MCGVYQSGTCYIYYNKCEISILSADYLMRHLILKQSTKTILLKKSSWSKSHFCNHVCFTIMVVLTPPLANNAPLHSELSQKLKNECRYRRETYRTLFSINLTSINKISAKSEKFLKKIAF